MQFKTFTQESGFKVLALAHLNSCEYSVVLYLLNCAVSGLDQLITTEAEIASLIGYNDDEVTRAIQNLSSRNIIKVRFGEPQAHPELQSINISLQYDLNKWQLTVDNKDVTSHDAIVFPFRRQGEANLKILEGEKRPKKRHKHDSTWKRVFESFVNGRTLDDREIIQAENAAQVLVETHPVDQVLLLIRHFGGRIPTLSLLASSWQHYQELFLNETQKVDILGARQKHSELDESLRSGAKELLKQANELKLTDDEKTVLQILSKHLHPRRQLFWAYQLRSRYPNLSAFFNDYASIMLPVTSTGTVIKKPFHNND